MRPGTAFVDVVLQRFRERFIAKIVAGPEGCHIWTGARNPKGYGVIRLSGRTFLAHRVAYELFRGEIPADLVIDHLCRTPSCVNVAHLEAVTHAENTRRGQNHQLNKTHCPHGHPYRGDNLIIRPEGRRCRACARAGHRAYKRRRATTPSGVPA